MTEDAPLNILLLAAEMVPFAKTGGLADVVSALPKALKLLGHDVRVAMPRYRRITAERFSLHSELEPYSVPMDSVHQQSALLATSIPTARGDLPVYMIDNAHYYNRDGIYMYEDDAERFIFFCRATIEGIKRLGWCPDVIHCHDWHTALVPNWLKTIYQDDPFFAHTASLYTIHNLAYQGIFGNRVLEVAGVDEYGFIAHPDTPHLNDVVDFMARGIYYADIINTVSETYAREILLPEYGEGLDPLLRDRRDRLFGVLNGIDAESYSPATDTAIAAAYDAGNLAGKADCKLDLQREAGLPVDRDIALVGVISRLSNQKGFDLIDAIVEPMLQYLPIQLVIMGTGEQRYHERLGQVAARYPEHCTVLPTFNDRLARKIYAGSDMFLMPSRFEPCGQGQMIALRYGSIPIARATGGLSDTVADFVPGLDQGNGFTFQPYDSMALYIAIVRAVETFKHHPVWHRIQLRAMAADHSWDAAARRYVDLYRRATAARIERPPHESYWGRQ